MKDMKDIDTLIDFGHRRLSDCTQFLGTVYYQDISGCFSIEYWDVWQKKWLVAKDEFNRRAEDK